MLLWHEGRHDGYGLRRLAEKRAHFVGELARIAVVSREIGGGGPTLRVCERECC